jgi:ABC-2 type transport system ATP-binding protein
VLTDLEETCDHLLLLADGGVRLAGPVEDLLAQHRILTGPAGLTVPAESVVDSRTTARQATVLARTVSAGAGWEAAQPTLEELTLAYLRASKEKAA